MDVALRKERSKVNMRWKQESDRSSVKEKQMREEKKSKLAEPARESPLASSTRETDRHQEVQMSVGSLSCVCVERLKNREPSW